MPMSYSYPSHMMHPSPMYSNPYYNTGPFSPPATDMSQQQTNSIDGRSSRNNNNENNELLEKVSNVLPEINRLLSEYRDTHGQLSAKENMSKQATLEHAEQLNKIRIELEANKKEYEKVIQNLVGDNSKLEREANNLRSERAKMDAETASLKKNAENAARLMSECEALRAEILSVQKARHDMSETLDSLRLSKEELMTAKLALEREVEKLRKDLLGERDVHSRVLGDLKQQHKDSMTSKEREHNRAVAENKVTLSKVQLELASLITRYTTMKRELESVRGLNEETKAQVDRKTKELDETIIKHEEEIVRVKK